MDLLYKVILILFFGILSCGTIVGQQNTTGPEEELYKLKMVNISVEYVTPRGNYARQLGDDSGWGISYSSLKELKIEQPFYLGFELYWSSLFSVSDFFTVNGIPIEDRVSVGNLGLNVIYRYFLPLNLPVFDFYVDGQAGGRLLYSLSRSFVEDTGENIDFFLSERDLVMNYGAALGVQIEFGKKNYILDFSASYNAGTSATFDGRDDSARGISLKSSTTNIIRFKLGLTYIN